MGIWLITARPYLLVAIAFALLEPSEKLQANDYPKSLEEVLAHVKKLEYPTEIAVKGYFYDESTQFFSRTASNGDLKIVIRERLEGDGNLRSEAFVRCQSYFFTATRAANDQPWRLIDFVAPINDEAEKLMEEEWESAKRNLPFRESACGSRLRTLLTHPDIVEVKLEPLDSDGMVKLKMNVPNPNIQLPDEYASDLPLWFKQAEVRLDPSQQYCVASAYTVASRFDSTETIRVLEWGEKDGRRYPWKSMHTHSLVGDLTSSEVTSIRFDEVPESEFTLEAFGIPNPYDSAPTDTLWSPVLIMAIVGAAFLVGGFAFRFAKRR